MEERIQLERERAGRLAAEEAVRLRDEFLGVAAHELKTPVTSLRLHAQLVERLLERPGEVDLARLSRRLGVVNEQSRRLADLVDHLLDVSRIANGRLALDPTETDVAALVADIVERQRALHPSRAFVVTAPPSLKARVDPLRLEQVLTNLLDNAVRYSPDGPIEVAVARPDPRRVRIEVRDHGPGVPEGQREHLFERFFPVDGLTARTGLGLGLGLYVSRQIVRQHGGELSAEFPRDGGSRFRAELPIDRVGDGREP
jgi:signal transduction histidine kinase